MSPACWATSFGTPFIVSAQNSFAAAATSGSSSPMSRLRSNAMAVSRSLEMMWCSATPPNVPLVARSAS